MDVVSVQNNAQGQIINIPENYRFSDDELYINRLGNLIILMPKNDDWSEFFRGLSMFSEDFMADGRGELNYEVREAL